MVKRITINLPDTVGVQLKKWADLRDQPISTAAAIAVELHMKLLENTGELPPAQQSKLNTEKST